MVMMMEAVSGLTLPDFLPYLLGIFGLLVLWQYHQIQVMNGRIVAIDVFDRSGIRMYVYAVPDDPSTCDTCKAAHGTVYLPSEVMKKDFSPLTEPCKGQAGCIGVLVGLYGAWPEARHVIEQLRLSGRKKSMHLSPEELIELIGGPWSQSVSADTDRLGIYMLEAIAAEGTNPDRAITNYRHILERATEVRHLSLIVPVYFRLAEMLIQYDRVPEALELIEQFEGRYKGKRSGLYAPTEKQLGLMSIKKSRLKNTSRQAQTASVA
ncbi:MAG: hypothetical protein OEV08_09830 [Nitrospira sp.]|nr:hypothetical protein [Nitrospira sp.]